MPLRAVVLHITHYTITGTKRRISVKEIAFQSLDTDQNKRLMPAPIGEPIAPSASGAVAAALVGFGQGFVPLVRNADTNGHLSRGSFDSIEDLGLEGKDVQAQVSYDNIVFYT